MAASFYTNSLYVHFLASPQFYTGFCEFVLWHEDRGALTLKLTLMDYGVLVWLALALVVGYLVYDTYYQGNLEYIRSSLDGREYLVQSLSDKQEAADLLAGMRERLETLVKHLEKAASDDPRTARIVTNFRADHMSEGRESSRYTSYSLNKGEKLVFCLRQKNANKTLMDLNTMMFVALHEIAHIGTTSVGHTPEFWDNFRWLLEHAVNVGVYAQQNFREKPVKYCGLDITSSPLQN